jgi:hypothetical protein
MNNLLKNIDYIHIMEVSDVIILFEWHFCKVMDEKNLETWIIDYIRILKASDVITFGWQFEGDVG